MNEGPVAGILLPGERLMWTGRPHPRRRFTPDDFFLVPLSVLSCGFAVSWELRVFLMPGPPPLDFALVGLAFILLGLYFVVGRFAYKAWRKRRTFYAVTDRRVLILTRALHSQVVSLDLGRVSGPGKSVDRDGTGTLTFGSNTFWAGVYANSGMEFFTRGMGKAAPAFYDIADVERVHRLICDLRAAK